MSLNCHSAHLFGQPPWSASALAPGELAELVCVYALACQVGATQINRAHVQLTDPRPGSSPVDGVRDWPGEQKSRQGPRASRSSASRAAPASSREAQVRDQVAPLRPASLLRQWLIEFGNSDRVTDWRPLLGHGTACERSRDRAVLAVVCKACASRECLLSLSPSRSRFVLAPVA